MGNEITKTSIELTRDELYSLDKYELIEIKENYVISIVSSMSVEERQERTEILNHGKSFGRCHISKQTITKLSFK